MTKRRTRNDGRPRPWKGAAGVMSIEEWAMHRHFDVYLDQVEDDKQIFIILRDGMPAAAVIAMQEFETMLVVMHQMAQAEAMAGSTIH
jgi:hypothetical protein